MATPAFHPYFLMKPLIFPIIIEKISFILLMIPIISVNKLKDTPPQLKEFNYLIYHKR